MEHIQGFTGSHWMLPSGKCLRHIAPAATMVNKFVETTKNTTKTQPLASNDSTFRALVICENFILPQNGPSTQRNNTIGAEELAIISSYQTLSADKSKKVIKQSRSSFKSWAPICTHRG
jgi:hypothetical protein